MRNLSQEQELEELRERRELQEYEQVKSFVVQGNLESLEKFFTANPYFVRENKSIPSFLDAALEVKKIPSIVFLINRGFVTRDIPLLSARLLSSPFPLYFYSDQQGNFQFTQSIPESEQKGSYFSLKDVAPDSERALELIDQYLYKKIRDKIYMRDIGLGKEDSRTRQASARSSQNLELLGTCLSIIYPKLPLFDMKEYLIKKEKESHRHYGDCLSDDSDFDDEKKNNSQKMQTPKKKIIKRKKKLSDSRSFKQKTKQTSPTIATVGILKRYEEDLERNLEALTKDIQAKNEIPPEADLIKRLQEFIEQLKEEPDSSSELAEDNKKLSGLKERARIPALEIEKKAVDQINSEVQTLTKRGCVISPEKLMEIIRGSKFKFSIAQYRGINYMIDRWNANSRRYHRTIDEVSYAENQPEKENKYEPSLHLKGLPQYSEIVLKTLPYCFYTELKAENDFTKIPEYKTGLKAMAKKIGTFLYEMDNTGPCFDDAERIYPYYFNSVGDLFQHQSSKDLGSHLSRLEALRCLRGDNYWKRELPSAHNPSIATGNIPYHALKYSYGLKNCYPHPLRPRYNRRFNKDKVEEVYAEYMHVGKFYVSLHNIEEILDEESVKRVSYLERQGRIHRIPCDIAYEKETSFLVFIPEGKVFHQFVNKFPSFKGPYKQIYQSKYGLNQSLYESFQYLLLISDPDTMLRDKIVELLTEWLCAYHEVHLLEMAAAQARKLNRVLVYLTRDNKLSFLPDENLPISSDPNFLEIHIHQSLRRTIALNQAWSSKAVLFHGFKLETSRSVEAEYKKFFEKSKSIWYMDDVNVDHELIKPIINNDCIELRKAREKRLISDNPETNGKLKEFHDYLDYLKKCSSSSSSSSSTISSTTPQNQIILLNTASPQGNQIEIKDQKNESLPPATKEKSTGSIYQTPIPLFSSTAKDPKPNFDITKKPADSKLPIATGITAKIMNGESKLNSYSIMDKEKFLVLSSLIGRPQIRKISNEIFEVRYDWLIELNKKKSKRFNEMMRLFGVTEEVFFKQNKLLESDNQVSLII